MVFRARRQEFRLLIDFIAVSVRELSGKWIYVAIQRAVFIRIFNTLSPINRITN